MRSLSLLTDLYQLTMLAGYHDAGKLSERSCFDLYFRRCPFGGSYCLAAGLEPALSYLENLRFTREDLDYLSTLELFKPSFLTYLREFRFTGDVWALSEGELVFPNVPLLRVEGCLGDCQLVESALLNIINFQTLVATKASRVKSAAGEGTVLEFGLRRAQGVDGALAASRAAYLGGCEATSNALAGKLYEIPVRGTHAHSWVMSFDSELEAFRAYARTYPDSCTLLVDTYDTLASGVPNAVTVGRELAEAGHTLSGIRLDSGDLAGLAKESRKLLDEGGLRATKIVASNDLDEHEIVRLKTLGAPIDVWGVGTNLVTCKDDPALGGVYKLAASGRDLTPRIKRSANPAKTTIPGLKQVYRFRDGEGFVLGDLISLESESAPEEGVAVAFHDPLQSEEPVPILGARLKPLLKRVMDDGKRLYLEEPLALSRERALAELATLPLSLRALQGAAIYRVGLSSALATLRREMLETAGK